MKNNLCHHRPQFRPTVPGLLMVALLTCCATAWGDSRSSDTQSIYSDRNGYFTAFRPAGWRQKDFPQETIRSKVEFIDPSKSDVSIRVIVGPTSSPSVTTEDFLQETRGKLPRLRSMAPGITWTASKETVTDREAVLLKASGPGLEQRIVQYIHGGLCYSIALNATTRRDFTAAEPLFNRFVASLALHGARRTLTEADRMAAQVARAKRLAILSEQTGQVANALGFADEGLAIDPNNEELKAIQRRLSSSR